MFQMLFNEHILLGKWRKSIHMQIWKRNRNQEEEKKKRGGMGEEMPHQAGVGVGNFWRAQCFLRDLEQPS